MMIVRLLYGEGCRMRLILMLALALAAVNAARAENFVFDTSVATTRDRVGWHGKQSD